MEEPLLAASAPQIPSPCTSGRTDADNDPQTSPEFEFWILGNPSSPPLNLLSADELFADGFVRPLHMLNLSNHAPPPRPDGTPEKDDPASVESDNVSAAVAASSLTISKLWVDIFRKRDKKLISRDKEIDGSCKGKKREKKNGVIPVKGAGAAELNINIWPFSRSISAGNGCTRPRFAAANRKVSSAPCSRSNSSGESKSRKLPSSPGRAGIHLGRTRNSPIVWQVRRGGSGRRPDAFSKDAQRGVKKDGIAPVSVAGRSKSGVLSSKVPESIGYQHQLSCRNDDTRDAVAAAGDSTVNVPGDGGRGSHLFSIRSFFTKRVY